MSKGLRNAAIVAGVLAGIALILLGVFTWFTRRAIPDVRGTLQVEGLQARVEVYRDENGVAHIYASNPHDLFFAQGFTHAQERFWQMEFQRRTAQGRLSEVFGASTLPTDRYLRHLNFAASSRAVYQNMSPENKAIMDAYAAGVNAYITSREPAELGLEFALLEVQGVEVEIEPWEGWHSIAWAYMMIYDQASRWNELSNLDRLVLLGEERAADFDTPYREDRTVIVQSEELDYLSDAERAALADYDPATLAYLRDIAPLLAAQEAPAELASMGFGQMGGSNSFAISGEMTDSGMPILGNDPHMGVNMPALWYEIRMACVEKSSDCIYNFRGFSLPGVPGILIGHNDRIAWGLTNASFDAEDVFIERINPENPNQYEVNGEWVDMETRVETIMVQGQDEPVSVVVRNTRNGVIITDSMVENRMIGYGEDGTELYALSYAWTGLQPVRTIEAVMGLIRAQGYEDYREALSIFDAGKQNVIYADVDGNIGYQLPGLIPVRAGGDGTLPVPAWNDDYIWKGYIPYDDLPRAFNPAQGFIVTANNPQVRYEDYPYLISANGHDRGQRATRISERILEAAASGGVSLEEAMSIQTDNTHLFALELIPYLSVLPSGRAYSGPRDMLMAWDGQMLLDSPEALIYNYFWMELIQTTFADQLPPDMIPAGKDATEDMMYFLLQQPESIWWDDLATPAVEDRDATLIVAFERAINRLYEEQGSDVSEWAWGDVHQITFRNATLGSSGIGIIEDIFNRGPYPTNGSESVPQKTCWDADRRNPATDCIPALRTLVDLGDLDNSRHTHSVGQSGHPYHPQYDHFIEEWRTLQYHAANWSLESVQAGRHDLLVLEPGN